MILPTKRLGQDRAMLTVGADVLNLLDEPKTVSRLWEELQKSRNRTLGIRDVTYDWFILALSFLYTLRVVEVDRGLLRKVSQ